MLSGIPQLKGLQEKSKLAVLTGGARETRERLVPKLCKASSNEDVLRTTVSMAHPECQIYSVQRDQPSRISRFLNFSSRSPLEKTKGDLPQAGGLLSSPAFWRPHGVPHGTP